MFRSFMHWLFHSFVSFLHIIMFLHFSSFIQFNSFPSFRSFPSFHSVHFISIIHFIHVIHSINQSIQSIQSKSYQFNTTVQFIHFMSFHFISCLSNSQSIPTCKLVPIVMSYFRNIRRGPCWALPGMIWNPLVMMLASQTVFFYQHLEPWLSCDVPAGVSTLAGQHVRVHFEATSSKICWYCSFLQ